MRKKALSWILTAAMVLSLFAVLPITAGAQLIITAPVAGGYINGYTVKSDETVWAWGENGYGQLGNGTNINSLTPVPVLGLTGVTAVAAGVYNGYALSAGGVWAWGAGNNGQLGNGMNLNSNVPVPVLGLNTGVTAIASRQASGYALKTDGTVWAWGLNQYGALGNGSTVNSNLPVPVIGLIGATAIACGNYSGYAVVGGEVWAWGSNQYGQLGDGTTASSQVPVKVSGLTGVTAVAAGFYTAYALKSDGTVWAWGLNDQGQLGIGTYFNGDYRNAPVQVVGLAGIQALAAEGYGGYALTSAGNVLCWGDTGNSETRNLLPVPVLDPLDGSGFLSNVASISGGFYSSYVLKSDKSVWSWGSNMYGALGNNSINSSLVPVQVSGFGPVAGPVCQIGAVPYSTLDEALAAVTEGQTITLLSNVSCAHTILVGSKSFQIDVSGHTLTVSSPSGSSCILASNGCDIGISDSSIPAVGGLILNASESASSCLCADGSGSTITVGMPAQITASGSGGCFGLLAQNSGAIEVTGDVLATGDGSYGVYANSGGQITVHGNVSGDRYGALAVSAGSAVTVSGNATAAGSNMGYSAAAAAEGNGSSVTLGGSAVVLGGKGYGAAANNGSSVTVSGNVTATGSGCYGAYATGSDFGGVITVEGSIDAETYLSVGGAAKGPEETTEPTTRSGYCTYKWGDPVSTVWVRNHALAAADTLLCEYNPNTNYGVAPFLEAGQTVDPAHRRSILIRFDVSSLPESVQHVKLRLTFSTIATLGCHLSEVTVHKVTSSWAENTVTYNTSPTWDPAAAATFDGTVYGPGTQGDVWEWDITGLYNQWKADPAGNFGVLLLAPEVDSYENETFFSREGAPSDAMMPQLVLETPVISITAQPAAATAVTRGSITGSLTCGATVSDSSAPVYTWYSCSAADKSNAAPLDPAVYPTAGTAGFTIPTDLTAGTYYYFCRVSAPGAEAVDSSVAAVTVSSPASGGSVSYYMVEATAGDHGTITPSGRVSVAERGSLTFTITPDTGYVIDDVLVDGSSAGAVSSYTFSSVAADHTIKAKFAHQCPGSRFTDVDLTQWYHEAVDYALLHGLFKGTSATTFEPDAPMTRAMLVTVLHRLEGTPAAGAGSPFADVASGSWYTDAVAWASASGIVKGYDPGLFGTSGPLTREQLAAILYRYAQYKGYDTSVGEDTNILSYEDASEISEYAIPAVQWACGAGVMQGDGARLDPKGSATRAQVAAMLMRFIETVVK